MRTKKTSTEEAVTIRGCVETVYFAAPQWSSGRLVKASGETVRFAGKLFARVGDALVLRGQWVHHEKFGRQFDARTVEYDLALDKTGLANYLSNHPDVKGIGPAKAHVLAEQFGDAFEHALWTKPETMADAARVPVETIYHLRKVWQENARLNVAAAWLASFGLTHHQVSSLLKRLGNSAVAVLKENPYLLTGEVPGFGFKRIDVVARAMGISKSHHGRIRAGIMDCIASSMNSGHCWIEYQELIEQANTLLTMDELDSLRWIRKTMDGLIGEGALASLEEQGEWLVADPRLLNMERFLCETFKTRRPNVYFVKMDIDALVHAVAPALNHGQHTAAVNALSHMVSLISGGAGSGKTFTIDAIVKLCESRGLSVELAAPTGKAAKRMEQVTGRAASTIHRLLGYNGEKWFHGPDNPLHTNVVIIDEMSMVDVPLAWRLFRAVDLTRTCVVLVGDHNQLPPVGPGNVLRDLVKEQLVPTVVLDEIVRQAGVLKENCMAILKGKVPPTSDRGANGRRAWHVIDDFGVPDHIALFIGDLYKQVLGQRLGFDLIKDVQVLTPTHKGPMGTRALNVMLQRLLQKLLFNVDVPPVPEGKRPRLLQHDKVIQTRNNYELGVMNGAVGTVFEVLPKGGLVVDFDGELVQIPAGSSNLQDIELAYGLSVHKGQGSEYPCVIAIIHKSHTFQHHRNLFYTAVTRARDTVIILGDAWGVRTCAQKRSMELRQTFLSLDLDWTDGLGG